MMWRSNVAEAAASLLSHRLRTTLSVLGVACGVATIMSVLAIGEGARRKALEDIGRLGVDNVLIRATAKPVEGRTGKATAPPLVRGDADMLARLLPSARAVAALRIGRADARHGSKAVGVAVIGVDPSWRLATDLRFASGRWFTERECVERRRIAMLGSRVAAALFGGQNPVGELVRVHDDWYRIVGTLDPESSGAGIDVADAVVMPIGAMDLSLGGRDAPARLSQIVVRAEDSSTIDGTAQVIASVLKRRQLDASAVEVVVPRDLLQQRFRSERTGSALLVAIGLVALIVSGIGIMNIMLAAVAERHTEVGVRRAVGARYHDIAVQLASEAGGVCAAGGVIGVAAGCSVALVVAAATGWPITISASGIGLALASAAAVGLVFGIYPALRAASIDPVAALRA